MYEENMILEPVNEQSLFFNGLSSMLTNFNQMLLAIHKVVIFSYQNEEKLMIEHLSFVEQKASSQLQLIELPTSWINTACNLRNLKTIYRFISRLIQSIVPLKQKATQSPVLMPILIYIKEIQRHLSKFNEIGSLAIMMKNIVKIFLAFCEDIRSNLKEQKFSIIPKIKVGKVMLEKKALTTQRSFYVESELEKKTKMLVKNLNQTFNTMKGLDLDYSYFRSSFFEAKNNTDLFGDYLRRNKQTKAQIQSYFRNFKEYKNRKQKKRQERGDRLNLFRKTKFVDCQGNKKILSGDNFSYKKKKSFDFTMKRINAFQHSNYEEDRSLGQNQTRSEKKEEKTFYKMKNIVISPSKVKISPPRKEIIAKVQRNITKNEQNSSLKIKPRSQNRSLIRNLRQITKGITLNV